MIIVTPYTMDCQEVIGLNMRVNARTMTAAAAELKQPVIIASKHWLLCGSGDERYLISDDGKQREQLSLL